MNEDDGVLCECGWKLSDPRHGNVAVKRICGLGHDCKVGSLTIEVLLYENDSGVPVNQNIVHEKILHAEKH